MGNSSSSSGRHQDETVDLGYLVPHGVYTGPRDWNQTVVAQLICARKLAPFYRPLEEYDESWTEDQILAARKELPESEGGTEPAARTEAPPAQAPSKSSHSKRPNTLKEPSVKPEAAVYRGAVECPICFLYYPPNINHSRCCDQAICTECFVQIKRAEPTTTHMVSEPAACPYCVQDNFGVTYKPPPWRTGLGSDGSSSPFSGESTPMGHKRRQKSFSADSPDVVTTDQIRPDWEAKLAAVRAAVARRANRRIVMRQVGDRLIPIGITSGRSHPTAGEEGGESGEGNGSRRSRRRQHGSQISGLEQYVGMGGQDLEELMIMEAMRLSMIEHEEQQRKEAEEKKKKGQADATQEATAAASSAGPSASRNSSEQSTASNTPQHRSSSSLSAQQDGRRSSSLTRIFRRDRESPTGRSSPTNPHPFSPMSAALGSSTTASAIPASTDAAAPSPSSGLTTSPGEGQNQTLSVATPEALDATSLLSATDRPGYDVLESSPDSVVAREPLLPDNHPPTQLS